MKASELITSLVSAIAIYGDRKVVAHDASLEAVDDNQNQFQDITFATDAADDGEEYPFELWFVEKGKDL